MTAIYPKFVQKFIENAGKSMDFLFPFGVIYVIQRQHNIYYDRRTHEIDKLERHVPGIQGVDFGSGLSKA